MIKRKRHIREIELSERARISRMFRQSEAGWLFYGPDGEAWHITAEEAGRYERAGVRQLEQYLAYQRRLPMRMLALGLLSGAAMAALVMAFPRGFFDQVGWLFGPVMFVTLLLQACGGLLYDLRLRRWQAGLARQFQAQQRGGVAKDIADRHRRYNLLRLAGQVLALALLARMGIGLWQHGDQFRPGLGDFALVVLAYGAHFAGQRIDTTHRRRKWLD